MANEIPGYSGGVGESLQTALPQRGSVPTPSATDPQGGFGTDSGLAGALGPPVRPLVGADAGGSSSGSSITTGYLTATGTDSGLASPPTGRRATNL
jgi:hypothetical protein